MTQHATMFTVGDNAPTAETISKNLHNVLMGCTPTLQNTGVGDKERGYNTGIAAEPPTPTAAGQKKIQGEGVWGGIY